MQNTVSGNTRRDVGPGGYSANGWAADNGFNVTFKQVSKNRFRVCGDPRHVKAVMKAAGAIDDYFAKYGLLRIKSEQILEDGNKKLVAVLDRTMAEIARRPKRNSK